MTAALHSVCTAKLSSTPADCPCCAGIAALSFVCPAASLGASDINTHNKNNPFVQQMRLSCLQSIWYRKQVETILLVQFNHRPAQHNQSESVILLLHNSYFTIVWDQQKNLSSFQFRVWVWIYLATPYLKLKRVSLNFNSFDFCSFALKLHPNILLHPICYLRSNQLSELNRNFKFNSKWCITPPTSN